mgnify:CR=1 FL=1
MFDLGSSYLALGYECNHNCICCPLTTYDRLHRRFSIENIKERIEFIDHRKRGHIVISGGEPMLHPDFFDVLDFINNKNFDVTVLSNASQCKEISFVKELCKHVVKEKFELVTAIHSSYPNIHDAITGVSGSLLETLTALDNLQSVGIKITIKHIFSKLSIDTLFDTFKYLEGHFPPRVNFQFCGMDYSGRAAKNISKLFLTLEEIRPELEKVFDFLETKISSRRQISIIEAPLCLTDPYYWKYFAGSSGELDAYIAPNIDEDKIHNKVQSECGAYYEPCEDCLVNKWCSGVWRTAYAYYGSDLLLPIINDVNEEE